MAIKVDRPAGGAGDDVVVFVARSLDDARAARDALHAAGVPCEMPDAGLEALFAAGAASVPVRVASRDVVKALDVIDARFPPPDEPIDLPSDPPSAGAPSAASPADAASEVEPGEVPTEVIDEAVRRARGARLEKTAMKVAVIACASALLPGLGLPFSAVAVLGGLWCLSRSAAFPDHAARVRRRAGVGVGVGVAALVWNAVVALHWMGQF